MGDVMELDLDFEDLLEETISLDSGTSSTANGTKISTSSGTLPFDMRRGKSNAFISSKAKVVDDDNLMDTRRTGSSPRNGKKASRGFFGFFRGKKKREEAVETFTHSQTPEPPQHLAPPPELAVEPVSDPNDKVDEKPKDLSPFPREAVDVGLKGGAGEEVEEIKDVESTASLLTISESTSLLLPSPPPATGRGKDSQRRSVVPFSFQEDSFSSPLDDDILGFPKRGTTREVTPF